ncbi:MAG: AAA family ATPase [Myxococcota bacterium]
MRLSNLTLRDFGPFDLLELELPPGRRGDRADVHLLVGPNGTGKTSILQAIAQLFTPSPTGAIGRIRSDVGSVVGSHGESRLVWRPRRGRERTIELDGERLGPLTAETPDHFGSSTGLVLHLMRLSGDQLYGRAPRFSNQHALVFAYGGQRHAPVKRLTSVSPLTDNPLAEAGLFSKPESEGAFAQWLANLVAQEALAEKQGDEGRAARLTGTLDRVGRALAAVTGSPVGFRVQADLSAVDLVLDGVPVPHPQLPAGLGALIAWVGDLLMRLDRLPWQDDLPIEEREFMLLLDEVEVHLHPAWQRRVLPMVERLFPKAQIIAATHSPFVIQSASDAWVHQFELEGGRSRLERTVRGPIGSSYSSVLRALMGVEAEYSVDTEARLTELEEARRAVLAGNLPRAEFDRLAMELGNVNDELYRLAAMEVRQLEGQLATRAALT